MTSFTKYITIPEDLYNTLMKKEENQDALGAVLDENKLLNINRNRRLEEVALMEKPINVNVVGKPLIPPVIEPIPLTNNTETKNNCLAVERGLIPETLSKGEREKEVNDLFNKINNDKQSYGIDANYQILKTDGSPYKRSKVKTSLKFIYGLMLTNTTPPGTQALLDKILNSNQKGSGICWQLW